MYPYTTADLYARLNLSAEASEQEIRRQFKKMVFLWHPDRNKEDTTGRLLAVIEAYQTLSYPPGRKRYDETFPVKTGHDQELVDAFNYLVGLSRQEIDNNNKNINNKNKMIKYE